MKKILIINGPNLNLLGRRENTIYGDLSFDEYLKTLILKYTNVTIEYFQSNVEGELINKIQSCINNFDGIVINPGAYGHTSIGIADAISAINIPSIEVHISNIYARENFRHFTLLGAKCSGSISGLGLKVYDLGIEAIINQNA